jgi:hypothetical protein
MLNTEWDIKSFIIMTHRTIGWNFEFKHVHSHQDDSVALEDLPLEVRLNVEADWLATDYLSTSEYQGRASLFPSAKYQLLLQGATVHRKLPNAIQYQADIGPLHKYLREPNSWSQETLETIHWWTAHGSAHSHHRAQQCF